MQMPQVWGKLCTLWRISCVRPGPCCPSRKPFRAVPKAHFSHLKPGLGASRTHQKPGTQKRVNSTGSTASRWLIVSSTETHLDSRSFFASGISALRKQSERSLPEQLRTCWNSRLSSRLQRLGFWERVDETLWEKNCLRHKLLPHGKLTERPGKKLFTCRLILN